MRCRSIWRVRLREAHCELSSLLLRVMRVEVRLILPSSSPLLIRELYTVDSNYLSAFLMTYRTFCTAHVLLDLLIDRFLVQPPPGLTADQVASWESKKQRPIRARHVPFLPSFENEN
jgi:hypothetical protein